jgi:hypothetical protein
MGRKTEAIYVRYRIVAEDEKASALLRMQQKSFTKREQIIAIPATAVQ